MASRLRVAKTSSGSYTQLKPKLEFELRTEVCVCGCRDLQVEKAPLESYADVGGLEQQIQEIKEVSLKLRCSGARHT